MGPVSLSADNNFSIFYLFVIYVWAVVPTPKTRSLNHLHEKNLQCARAHVIQIMANANYNTAMGQSYKIYKVLNPWRHKIRNWNLILLVSRETFFRDFPRFRIKTDSVDGWRQHYTDGNHFKYIMNT